MHDSTIFRKTAKGVAEVSDRRFGLDKHLRRVLIMIDGSKDVAELSTFVRPGELDDTLSQLMSQGFIEVGEGHPDDTGEAPRPHQVPAANEPAVFALIKQHAMAEISTRLGPVANLLITEIESCKNPLELRLKLRNIENVLVNRLGAAEGTDLARRIGSELTRLVERREKN
jgi:hypothetical protein